MFIRDWFGRLVGLVSTTRECWREERDVISDAFVVLPPEEYVSNEKVMGDGIM